MTSELGKKEKNENLPKNEKKEADKIKETIGGIPIDQYRANGDAEGDGIPIVREQSIIPVRKPNKQEWFRVHRHQSMMVYLTEDITERTPYLVHPDALPYLVGQVKKVKLYRATTLQGSVFLIPVPQMDSSGNWNRWHRSLSLAVETAIKFWVRIQSDQASQGYIIIKPTDKLKNPEWKDMTMEELVTKAFEEWTILDEKHPFIQRLAGKQL
jgi:hypothetical protein